MLRKIFKENILCINALGCINSDRGSWEIRISEPNSAITRMVSYPGYDDIEEKL